MAEKTAKTRKAVQTQLRPSLQAVTASPGESPATATSTLMQADHDITALRLELLTSLRKDIADIFKKALQETLSNTLSTIKLDLQAVKTQLAHDKAATDASMATLRGIVGEMEQALSGCTADIAQMKTTIKTTNALLLMWLSSKINVKI